MEIGDVVHLKSGGANMTVAVAPTETETAVCKWHDEAGVPHVERYEAATLVVKETKAAPAAKK